MSTNTNIHAFIYTVQLLLKQPAQFLPHLTIPTFAHLPEQLGEHLPAIPSTSNYKANGNVNGTESEKQPKPTIRALVLDKDNTLSPPKTTDLPTSILTKLRSLRTSPTSPFNLTTAPSSILIVSNRAGSHPRFDPEVHALETALADLRIPVYRLPEGCRKKPFCGDGVVKWFQHRGVVRDASEIAVVGDRLGTDVVMAGLMGSWSVWCRDGVVEGKPGNSVLERMERCMEKYLRESRGLCAPLPRTL